MEQSKQGKIFETIANKLNPDEKMVDLIAEYLCVSSDSAYRRIRGETALTFDELVILANKFEISIDALLIDHDQTDSINFLYETYGTDLIGYLRFVEKEFKYHSKFKEHELIYSAKDLVVHYYFAYPEIAAFIAFVYFRVLWSEPAFNSLKFNFELIHNFMQAGSSEPLLAITDNILEHYQLLSSIEIWNNDTFNGWFSQIVYCWESGLFDDKHQALLVIGKTREMLKHLEIQASLGKKFLPGKLDQPMGDYHLYYIDAVQLEHTIWRKTDQMQRTYLIYNSGDYLQTSNVGFCNRTEFYLKNLLKKSTLISGSGEKTRKKLFREINNKLNRIEASIG